MQEKIVLAAGCFWKIQWFFDQIIGITNTTVGFSGGNILNPSYKEVCQGHTGAIESVFIKFDSKKITLSEILDLFFQIHDPTTPNRQGEDVGEQYQSAIFYTRPDQEPLIHKKIKEYTSYFQDPILTKVTPLYHFSPAEEEHQKYYEKKKIKNCPDIEKNKNSILQKKLTPSQYFILRNRGTEPPFSGKYLYYDEKGTYHCAACGQKLFKSEEKFQSSCGWPSFDQAIDHAVLIRKDFTHFMLRNEIICSRCLSHLGHLFNDGPTKTGLRFCINSGALKFKKQKEHPNQSQSKLRQ